MSQAARLFDDLSDSAYVRESQLVRPRGKPNSVSPLPFSAPTLWRKVKEGTFPPPVKLSARVSAWQVGTVRAWLEMQITAGASHEN